MGTLGIMAFVAAIHLFPAEGPQPKGEAEPPRSEASETSDGDVPRVGLLAVENRLRRGETIRVDTPVGRVEVMLLSSDAQLQLGLLEEPLDEAVVGFAPAGVFSRKERPTGRVVVSLPVLRF